MIAIIPAKILLSNKSIQRKDPELIPKFDRETTFMHTTNFRCEMNQQDQQ